jgi:hypothetical protein
MTTGTFSATINVSIDNTANDKGLDVVNPATGATLTTVPAGGTGSASYSTTVLNNPVLEFKLAK